jgi:branched-subunit amino acid transport protein
MRETDPWTLLVIVGLAAITVIARGFFFISEKPWRLPGWALRGLRYAPVAALTAVIAPDILLAGQALSAPWRDARLLGAIAAAAFYFWRRGASSTMPLSIAVGMAVYLPLHVGWGW